MRALLVLSPLMGLAPTACNGSIEIAKEAQDASTSGDTPDAGPLEDSPVDAVAHAMDAAPTPDSSQMRDAASAVDGTPSAGPATTYFLAIVNIEGALTGGCLPESLPVNGAGQAGCKVFYELAAGDTCAAHPGLTAPAADVVASLRNMDNGFDLDVDASQPLCVLAQLPMAEWIDGSCETSSSAGWCYLTGSAAGSCADSQVQSQIMASPSGEPPAGAFAILGCGGMTSSSGGASNGASLGAQCVPSPELSAGFPGFSQTEVTLDENNSACGSGAACVVNHFEGLTSCPYGQDAGADACTVPGTSTPVRPAVRPQVTPRLAENTVYCSCRCENGEGKIDDGASYCACPVGYTCSPLVPTLVSGDPKAGSYCIKSGTAYSPLSAVEQISCEPSLNPCP
jgi:hypothetical protein